MCIWWDPTGVVRGPSRSVLSFLHLFPSYGALNGRVPWARLDFHGARLTMHGFMVT